MNKRLTGWLILLIVLLIGSFGSAGSAAIRIDKEWREYLADYPSLRTAIMALKVFNGAMVCAAFYTAWILSQKKPGTLHLAKTGLLVCFALKVVGAFSFPMLAGLPNEVTTDLLRQATNSAIGSLIFTTVWFLYLMRSTRVKEIYTESPGILSTL
jgi:hypothetical protein